jgi:hypothetical protein
MRRVLAERSALSGVIVGTWQELMERARLAYLLPDTAGDEDISFKNALEELDNPFWAESFAVAPDETAQAVKSALIQVVSATDPASAFEIVGLDDLSERPRRHLADLIRLARSLDEQLPTELATIRSLLRADSDRALHPISVYRIEGVPGLTVWQTRLVEKMNLDAGSADDLSDDKYLGVLNDVLGSDFPAYPGSSLHLLQERLFGVIAEKGEVDQSLQWVGARDFLQEDRRSGSRACRYRPSDTRQFRICHGTGGRVFSGRHSAVGIAGGTLATRSWSRGCLPFSLLPAKACTGHGPRSLPVIPFDALVP